MSASIKASCPSCHKLIRIPLEWSERAMKCKKCGTLVQMKRKESPPRMTASVAAAPTLPVSAYEPTCETPVYASPPQPEIPPPPAYSYPLPYPMPPQYGAPQQAYGYPYPQPPAYGYPQPPLAAVQPAATDSTPFSTDGYTPSRRTYQRSSGSVIPKIIALAIAAVVIAGSVFIGMKMSNSFMGEGSQTKVEEVKLKDKEKHGTTPATTHPAIVSDPFPRRMLFVHVSKYVFFNSLTPGSTRGEDMPTYAAKKMAYDLRIPTDDGNNQLFVLSDSVPNTPPMLKSVLLGSFEQFFNTSRDQDRIVVYFSGHAREVEGKAYIVPVDGDPDDVSTLLPVEEIYARLAVCKAQQKILILDVCRFNPSVGSARVGSEPMSEKLAELLHKVPPGVEILTSCSAGQNAQETIETGSEFLAAFRVKSRELKSSGALSSIQPGMPIRIEKWADALREYLAKDRGYAPPQTVKTTMNPPGPQVEYNKDAPIAARFNWPTVPPGANPGDVGKMIALLELPGLRTDITLPAGLALVYPFDANTMRQYAADDITDEESVKSDKFPLRKATWDALNFIREHWKFGEGVGIRESLNGSADDALKKEIVKEQGPVARLELELKTHMDNLEIAARKSPEKSKRWQAVFEYTLAQIQMRWAFVNEYNLALGNIRTDSLEKPVGGGTPVYRLVSVEKMKSKKDTTEKADAAKETFEKLAKEHKGTPIAILAKMNQNIALGLTWKLEVQQAPMAEEKKE